MSFSAHDGPPLPATRRLLQPDEIGRGALWRADRWQRATASPTPVGPTGFAALDAQLPGGGWPLDSLIELLGEPGSGEVALLAPLFRCSSAASQARCDVLWVAPPWCPYGPALQTLGLPLRHFTWIDPACPADAAWSAEQALRSGACAVVLWWSREPVANVTLRRLHLAAQAGGTPLFALRPATTRAQSSPAPLRLLLQSLAGRQMAVEVFKRRGPPMDRPLLLALPDAPPWPAARRHGRTHVSPVLPLSSHVVAGLPSAPSVTAGTSVVEAGL